MEKEIVKEYTNGELTIEWRPKKCIHAAVCVKMLPKVYDPKAKPWITMVNASTSDLEKQIQACPSGALSSYRNIEGKKENLQVTKSTTKIEVVKNGPLFVYGALKVTDREGNITEKTERTSFCRCGASANKPYCDGQHRKIQFKDL